MKKSEQKKVKHHLEQAEKFHGRAMKHHAAAKAAMTGVGQENVTRPAMGRGERKQIAVKPVAKRKK